MIKSKKGVGDFTTEVPMLAGGSRNRHVLVWSWSGTLCFYFVVLWFEFQSNGWSSSSWNTMKIHIWFNYLLVSQRAQSLTYVKVGPDSRIVISINKNSNKFMYTGKFDIIKSYEDPGQWQTRGFRTFNLETLWIPSFPYVCLKPFSNTRMSRFQAFHNCLKPLEDKNDDLNVNHILILVVQLYMRMCTQV